LKRTVVFAADVENDADPDLAIFPRFGFRAAAGKDESRQADKK
jgi:hypothetical protein